MGWHLAKIEVQIKKEVSWIKSFAILCREGIVFGQE
jgi:hypothetical protein